MSCKIDLLLKNYKLEPYDLSYFGRRLSFCANAYMNMKTIGKRKMSTEKWVEAIGNVSFFQKQFESKLKKATTHDQMDVFLNQLNSFQNALNPTAIEPANILEVRFSKNF